MKKFLSILCAFMALPIGLRAEGPVEYRYQVEAIESQAEVACANGKHVGPVRSQLAEQIFGIDGSGRTLLLRLQNSSQIVSHQLAHAQEIVMQKYDGAWNHKMENSKDSINLQTRKLSSFGGPKRSLLANEEIRDGIRAEYKKLQWMQKGGMLRDTEFGPKVAQEIQGVRQKKSEELAALADLGERLDKAMMKATDCYCRSGGPLCMGSKSDLDAASAWYKSAASFRQARYDYYGKAMENHRSDSGSQSGK